MLKIYNFFIISKDFQFKNESKIFYELELGSKYDMIFHNNTTFIFGLLMSFLINWKLFLYMFGTFIMIGIFNVDIR